MAPNLVYNLLKQRLAACLMEGTTSITEYGITVSTERLSGEIILFFRIDSDAGRICLDMVGLKACDCLVFYTRETEQEEKLCFLELKGNGLASAVQQIVSAHRKIKLLLEANHIQNVTLIACICMRHQVPQGDLRHADELKRYFGKGNVHLKCGRKHYTELGLLFRKRASQ